VADAINQLSTNVYLNCFLQLTRVSVELLDMKPEFRWFLHPFDPVLNNALRGVYLGPANCRLVQ